MGREDIEVLYEMLSTKRRRRALAVLADAEKPLGRDELAQRIVARRSTDEAGGVEPNKTGKTDVKISLGHIHLPKLKSGGVVERTAEEGYAVTPLGYDLERAARAFETSLDPDKREIEGTASPTNQSDAVSASDCDDGR